MSESEAFAGIQPASAPGFLLGELAGVLIAIGLVHYLFPTIDQFVVPHPAN